MPMGWLRYSVLSAAKSNGADEVPALPVPLQAESIVTGAATARVSISLRMQISSTYLVAICSVKPASRAGYLKRYD